MAQLTTILFPVGRLVGGSVHTGSTVDMDGRPLVYKSGADAGKPRTEFWFAVAFEKKPGEASWTQTPWGAVLYQVANAAFPQGQANAPTFKWKVTDGDSNIPNARGRKPCDAPGHKGHWVVRFSGSYAPKLVDARGTRELTAAEVIKLGYYVQPYGDVSGNAQVQQPGIYINHRIVALAGHGEEIILGPDPASLGFGGAPLPAGASTVPVGMPAGAVPPMAAAPMVLPAAAAAPMVPPAAAPMVPPVVPNPAFLQVPGAPAAPVPTAKLLSIGHTVETMMAGGWTLDLLRQQGYVA